MSTKSIWIEIDSLHSDILLRGIREGLMPNIARIMERGGASEWTMKFRFRSRWASAHTGLSVTEHSAIAYDRIHTRHLPDAYRYHEPVPSGTAYWHLLGKTGKRVLVINSVNPIHDGRRERHPAQRLGGARRRPPQEADILSARNCGEP